MLRRTFAFLLPILMASGLIAAPSPGFAAPSQRLVYAVHHSRYGNIGTYSNAVDRTGDATTVRTEAHIKVSILGVVLYRQDAAREERWSGDRLVAFHGVTTVNGRPYELNGAADGDRFVLMSPDGPTVAPASVRIANPWSINVLRGDTLLTPDRGRIENVQMKGGEDTTVTINGRAMSAKRYEIDRLNGQKRYEVWLDDRGTPVMFTTFNPNGSITFTLS
jgi:hypothetical protein